MQQLENLGKRAAIDRYMQSGVVPQKNRAVSEIVAQPFAVASTVFGLDRPPGPGPLGQTPPVHEDGDAVGGGRVCLREGLGRQHYRFVAAPDRHRAGERALLFGQHIAVDSVDRRNGSGGGVGA